MTLLDDHKQGLAFFTAHNKPLHTLTKLPHINLIPINSNLIPRLLPIDWQQAYCEEKELRA